VEQTLQAPTPTDDFASFVAARGAALQRFAHLVTGAGADAPDLVQDALERAYPRWSTLSRTATAEAYVRRSIVNASVSRWRKHRRLVVVDDTDPLRREHVPDPGPAVDDADEAWRLCRTLPARQRAAVVLRFYEDRSFAEVGDLLGCSEATARSLVHRAVGALRERLDTPDDAPRRP
jgi:RNA polymerase sigma-70 factor (sigma-E family)